MTMRFMHHFILQFPTLCSLLENFSYKNYLSLIFTLKGISSFILYHTFKRKMRYSTKLHVYRSFPSLVLHHCVLTRIATCWESKCSTCINYINPQPIRKKALLYFNLKIHALLHVLKVPRVLRLFFSKDDIERQLNFNLKKHAHI